MGKTLSYKISSFSRASFYLILDHKWRTEFHMGRGYILTMIVVGRCMPGQFSTDIRCKAGLARSRKAHRQSHSLDLCCLEMPVKYLSQIEPGESCRSAGVVNPASSVETR